MDYLISLDDCRVNGYKLSGENIREFYEEALELSNESFLKYYDEISVKFTSGGINPLWLSGADPKDAFWNVNYFLFNTALLRLIGRKYRTVLRVNTDACSDEEWCLLKFCRSEGIFITNYDIGRLRERRVRQNLWKAVMFLHAKFLTGFKQILKSLYKSSGKKSLGSCGIHENGKNIYFYIEKSAKDFKTHLAWRYGNLIEKSAREGFNAVLFSAQNIKGCRETGHSFLNVLDLVSFPTECALFVKSVLYETKILFYIMLERAGRSTTAEYEYFLSRVPADVFHLYKIKHGFGRLFEVLGPGLLLQRGSLVNKLAPVYACAAHEKGVRVFGISGRVLTPERLSNRVPGVYTREENRDKLPDAFMVFDKISKETIDVETRGRVRIYRGKNPRVESAGYKRPADKPFSVTVVLQSYSDNTEKMIESAAVCAGSREGIRVYFKMHPNFPVSEDFKNRYADNRSLYFLPVDTSLEHSVDVCDACVSGYSSAALEFAKKGKPVIWVPYITLNSIFNREVERRLGTVARGDEELEKIITRMARDTCYYKQKSKRCLEQIKNLCFEDEPGAMGVWDAVKKEYEKHFKEKSRLPERGQARVARMRNER